MIPIGKQLEEAHFLNAGCIDYAVNRKGELKNLRSAIKKKCSMVEVPARNYFSFIDLICLVTRIK